MSGGSFGDEGTNALLLLTWSDGEAEVVRHLLETYGIRCQVVSDVTHAILPLSVDGLGEIRILVASGDLEEAQEVLAEHRRQGLELVAGGKEDALDAGEVEESTDPRDVA